MANTQVEALKLALEALESTGENNGYHGVTQYFDETMVDKAITAIKAALEAKDEPVATIDSIEQEIYENTRQFVSLDVMEWMLKRYYTTPSQQEAKYEPVAWMYDVTYNQDGTVSVALPDGDELRIVLPNQQEPYCWTWDVWVSGGKWRAEYGWKKPTEKVVNLQPLYTTQPQRKPLTELEAETLFDNCGGKWNGDHWVIKDADLHDFARAIEAKLKEKNT